MVSDINLTCDQCGHVENYKYEEDLFQDGKMWGLPDDKIYCSKCLED